MTFKELNIIPPILRALEHERYVTPTPIQEQAIPPVMAGRDLLGCAQTGTGKTAAFAIPILQLLGRQNSQNSQSSQNSQTGPGRTGLFGSQARRDRIAPDTRRIRALILTPTRELALQIHESFCTYGHYTDIRSCVVYGGVSQKPQEMALRRGVDILVATPGRLGDLISQKLIDLQHISILTLDEADRMLDMGFIHDVKKIIAMTPAKRQTLFFSATMPPEIAALSKSMLIDPVRVSITPDSPTVDAIDQTLYRVDKVDKCRLLLHLLEDPAIVSALVFTRTKHGADRVVRELVRGDIAAQAIHGNKSQNARQQALGNFKDGAIRVLVATDIAARGLDINELSHVINFDLPDIPESYVHRIGRTGRAGRVGTAISFCDIEEMKALRDIERLCGKPIVTVREHPFLPKKSLDPGTPVTASQRSADQRPVGRRPEDRHDRGQAQHTINRPIERRSSGQTQTPGPARQSSGRSIRQG